MKLQQYLCLMIIVLCGLGSTSSAAEEPLEDDAPVFYPPAPNLPRLQYLTKYSSAYDTSGEESGFRDFIFGGADEEEQAINKPYGVAMHDGAIYAIDTRGSGYVVFDVANGKWNAVRGSGDGAMPNVEPPGALLRLAVVRRGRAIPVSDADPSSPRDGDVLYVAVFEDRRQEAEAGLERNGWARAGT